MPGPVQAPKQLIWVLRREGGGATKIQIFSQNQAPPPLQIVFWAFSRPWARVTNPKNQICNLVFGLISMRPSFLKWAFRPFARPRPSPQTANLGFGKEGRGGGGEVPKFTFSALTPNPALIALPRNPLNIHLLFYHSLEGLGFRGLGFRVWASLVLGVSLLGHVGSRVHFFLPLGVCRNIFVALRKIFLL